jgi:hypothetical protein
MPAGGFNSSEARASMFAEREQAEAWRNAQRARMAEEARRVMAAREERAALSFEQQYRSDMRAMGRPNGRESSHIPPYPWLEGRPRSGRINRGSPSPEARLDGSTA